MIRRRVLFKSKFLTGLLALVLPILLASCGDTEQSFGCTSSLVAGIELEVRDSVTDMPIAENAIAVLKSGFYEEVMAITGWENSDPSSAFLLSGAYERPGIYDINLIVMGYESWSRGDVEVEDIDCHVTTVRFTVRLNSLPL